MKNYSLLFGIMGIIAGLVLLVLINVMPKPAAVTIPPLPPETLVYNVGTAHELPGTSSMLYENPALGIRFGYPKSYGTVVVEANDGSYKFSFSPSGAANDPRRTEFMNAPYTGPEKRNNYWGDLAQYVQIVPRWSGESADVCSFIKEVSNGLPAWAKQITDNATCSNMPFSGGEIAKLSQSSSSTYIIPALQTVNDQLIIAGLTASDINLIASANYLDPQTNLEKIVKSIDFIEPIK